MAEISRNISETLKSVNLKNPVLSTLAKKGDESLVQRFLTENIQLGTEKKDTIQSQLYIASFWGFSDVVKSLVANGADVNAKNHQTLWTPLHAASFQEHGKIIMFLLQHNADSWSEDYEGRTPKDFGSASDKIWPLFASCGCTRTAKNTLMEKGVLRKAESMNSNNMNASGERDVNSMRKGNLGSMINYDNVSLNMDNTNERSAYAASIDGDVLAGDAGLMKAVQQEEQPNFNVWRN